MTPLAATLVAILLRAVLDHARTMIAHRTAARVQEALRGKLYDKIAELGPAWFAGERTGGVMLSVVDGVEQLQSFFGQYVPQVCGRADAAGDLRLYRVVGRAGRDGDAGRGAGDADRADGGPRAIEQARARGRGDEGVRLGVSRRGAGSADPEGVRPEHRLRPGSPSGPALSDTTMRVPGPAS